MRSRVVLETIDGESVHTAEVEDDPMSRINLILWDGRLFIRDIHWSELKGRRYVEAEPHELPIEVA